jgi:MFS superfamily sulfate permease-like transporter
VNSFIILKIHGQFALPMGVFTAGLIAGIVWILFRLTRLGRTVAALPSSPDP